MLESPSKVGSITPKTQTGVLDSPDRGENIFGTRGVASDYFSSDEYRAYQKGSIEQIEESFEQGYKYVVLEAPTGTGKSLIGCAFAFQSADAHYLTVQKILQDQLENDLHFQGKVFVMKGRSAYDCLADGSETCLDGPCRRSKQYPRHKYCPYSVARTAAAKADVTVHNFDSFYYQTTFADAFKGRKLLVIDECHNIESKYGEFMSFTLTSKMGFEIPEFTRLKDYDSLVKVFYHQLSEEKEELEKEQEDDMLSKDQMKRLDQLRSVTGRLYTYVVNRERDKPIEYVFDWSDIDGVQRVQFRPVMIGDFAARMLFPFGQRVLMMSATILNKEIFCESVGLDPQDVAFIQVPSSFPSENRPIIRSYVGSMSYKSIDKTLPKLVEEIERILAKFPDRKGIIQTHSDKIANYIKDNISDPRLTFNKDFPTPFVMLVAHRMKDASFIVAAGLREGLDLYGDLSKIQIFCKVPYPSLADKRVKRRMEIDPEWYGYQTALMFVQALGRSVRSKRERAVTYMLDSNFGFFYKKNKQYIPKYIKEAIEW